MMPPAGSGARPAAAARLLCVLSAALALVACAPAVDPREALEITEVTTGWYDAGIVDGKNKLVPAISFRLRNTGDVPIDTVQVNALFRRLVPPEEVESAESASRDAAPAPGQPPPAPPLVPEPEEWGTAFVRAIGSEGLDPGETTGPIVLRSALGYTGEQTRAEMLAHSQFRDAQVEIFLKHGAAQWVKLREIRIERQLVTQ